MSRNNTGNPIGSKAFPDFEDNVKNLDEAVNTADPQWVDRFGRFRLPLMEQERQFVSDQERREGEFQADQSAREQEFRTLLASSGYQFVGDYAAGIEITEYNQLIRDSSGEFWRVSGQVDLPYTTTGEGLPESDAFVPAGDAVLRQELAERSRGTWYAADFGASVAASWDQNRDAINNAIDSAHASGGGTVVLPSGDITVKGIIQKAHTTIEFQSTRLIHPDGNGISIISSDVSSTTGAMTAGSYTLNVADSSTIESGAVVAVGGAGGINEAAIWSLEEGINSTQTSGVNITLPVTGLNPNGGFLIVDDEIIQYSGISGASLTGVVRGALGTVAAPHAAAAWIGQSINLYARVESINGTNVTLDKAALVGVSGAIVDIGPVGLEIAGLAKFHGNTPPDGADSTWYAINWQYVGGGKIGPIDAERCAGALMLGRGSKGCQVGSVLAVNCGNAPVSGSAVWIFRGACNNEIGPITVSGEKTYTGLYIDDRTSYATEYDGPCNDNIAGPLIVNRPFSGSTPPGNGIAVNITGSGGNTILGLSSSGLQYPIVIAGQSQNQRPDGSVNPHTTGNVVFGGSVNNCQRPWVIDAPGNTIIGLWWRSVTGSLGNSIAPVTTIGVSEVSGAPPTIGRFDGGSASAPGISFHDDRDTGIFRIVEDDIGISAGGVRIARFRIGNIWIGDGVGIQLGTGDGTSLGTGASQKLGFWGANPKVQPAAISNVSGDNVVDVAAQLNLLLGALRSIGLIGS